MKTKIMICDDDVEILEITTMILEHEGFNVIYTAHSQLAEDMCLRELPDLLLIDLWMPYISGDQIIKSLKANPLGEKVPMIVFSASSAGEQTAKECGANNFISKPYDIDDLVKMIKNTIKSV